MKRISFLIMLFFVCPNIFAQSIIDALRYSTESLHGTARYSSMSGAFGALGGDLSAIKINPAGSAIFLTSASSVSLSVVDKTNNSNYFNTQNKATETDFNFSQAGAVFVFDNANENSIWKKFSLGLNFDRINNFDDAFFASGQSNSSIDAYFLGYAQGVSLNLLQLQSNETISSLYRFLGENQGFGAQQAFLGFQSFIINPIDFDNPNNSTYVSNVSVGLKNQAFSKSSSGYNSKFTINLGTQINENLFLGVNLNSHIIDYRESTLFFEESLIPQEGVNQIGFRNNLNVDGDGFSAQFGFILRATPSFRIGATYETPTWYSIFEETSQAISTTRLQDDETITEEIFPNVINIFEEYTLKTPGKFSASIAYLFGQKGLISIDYNYKDFSNIEFRPSGILAFNLENRKINNLLKATSSINIGGEYRIDKLSLRGGFKYEESPYKNTDIMDDLTGFSFGFGYNFGAFKVDLAYARTEQDRQEQFFVNSAFSNAANVNTTENFFSLTTNFTF